MFNAHAMRKHCTSRAVTSLVTAYVALRPRFD